MYTHVYIYIYIYIHGHGATKTRAGLYTAYDIYTLYVHVRMCVYILIFVCIHVTL